MCEEFREHDVIRINFSHNLIKLWPIENTWMIFKDTLVFKSCLVEMLSRQQGYVSKPQCYYLIKCLPADESMNFCSSASFFSAF